MRKVILLFLLFSLPGASQAYDEEGVKYIYGIGNTTCSTFLDGYLVSNKPGEYAGYLDGYMSATNAQHMGKADYLGKPERKDSLEWIATFCKNNSKETFDYAVSTYLLHLMAAPFTN